LMHHAKGASKEVGGRASANPVSRRHAPSRAGASAVRERPSSAQSSRPSGKSGPAVSSPVVLRRAARPRTTRESELATPDQSPSRRRDAWTREAGESPASRGHQAHHGAKPGSSVRRVGEAASHRGHVSSGRSQPTSSAKHDHPHRSGLAHSASSTSVRESHGAVARSSSFEARDASSRPMVWRSIPVDPKPAVATPSLRAQALSLGLRVAEIRVLTAQELERFVSEKTVPFDLPQRVAEASITTSTPAGSVQSPPSIGTVFSRSGSFVPPVRVLVSPVRVLAPPAWPRTRRVATVPAAVLGAVSVPAPQLPSGMRRRRRRTGEGADVDDSSPSGLWWPGGAAPWQL